MTGERDMRGVMQIVVPDGIDAEAAACHRSQQPNVLPFIFGDNQDRPVRCGGTRRADDLGKNVLFRGVVDVLRRVETQAVEVELVDPIGGIGRDKLPHGSRILNVPTTVPTGWFSATDGGDTAMSVGSAT
jgi:hypothetical protein